MSKLNLTNPFKFIAQSFTANATSSSASLREIFAPIASYYAAHSHDANSGNLDVQASDEVGLNGMSYVELGVVFNSHF
jgi:hypothetical protein